MKEQIINKKFKLHFKEKELSIETDSTLEVLDLTVVLLTLNICLADSIISDMHQIMHECKVKYLGYEKCQRQDKMPSPEEF